MLEWYSYGSPLICQLSCYSRRFTQIANKFGHRLNVTCSLQPKWRPYVAQPVYERLHRQFESPSWYGPRYNSLQSYPSSKNKKAIDCLETLGIEFDELSMLRVQKKEFDGKYVAPNSILKSKVELALANMPPNVRSRWIHRATSLQSTMLIRMDTVSNIHSCFLSIVNRILFSFVFFFQRPFLQNF